MNFQHNMDAYKQKCMRQFTFMHQKYPTLFFSLIENPTTFPIYRLEEMLSLKKTMNYQELNIIYTYYSSHEGELENRREEL